MTISFTRGNFTDAAASGSSITCAYSSNNAGALLVVSVGWVDTAGTLDVSSISDTAGNTWTAAGGKTRNATQQYALRTYYAWGAVGSGGTNTVTVNFSSATTFRRCHIQEYGSTNGAWTADPLDKTGTGTGSSTALATASMSPVANGELIYTFGAAGGGNVSAAGSFTLRQPSGGGFSTGSADLVQGVAASVSGTLTASGTGQWGIQAATFQDTPAKGIASAVGAGVATATVVLGATASAVGVGVATAVGSVPGSGGVTPGAPVVVVRSPLAASHGRYTRIEAWYAGVKVGNSFLPESGSVAVTARNRVRRTMTAVLAEKNWPASISAALAPYGARLKVFQGITGANGQLLLPEVPVFGGRVETVRRDRLSGRMTVTGNDPFADINDAQFEQPFSAGAGSGVVPTLASMISDVFPAATIVDLTGSTAQLPTAMMWDTDRGKAIDDLAAAIGAEVFFLPDDTTCVIRPVPMLGGASVWSLVQGRGSTIVRDSASRSRTDVANRIIVHVDQPGQPSIIVTVTDDNPLSATRYGGPYGMVVRHMTNALIGSSGQAYQAGQAKLARSIGATRTRDVDHVPNPALEAGDLFTITTDEGTEQHVADSFTLPFAVTDVMTTSTRSTGTSVS